MSRHIRERRVLPMQAKKASRQMTHLLMDRNWGTYLKLDLALV
jgi:hypothetical protein